MTRRRYTLVFEHGDAANQWIAHVREVPQCHTFGRGLAQARARIREALALWEGPRALSADLREVLPLPDATKKRVAKLAALRREARRLAEQTRTERARIVADLQDRWSMRDIGDVLEISHQRVAQLSGPRPRRQVRRRSKAGKR